MTNRDRDSVAKFLAALAGRLEDAPASTGERAKRHADAFPLSSEGARAWHQVGGLEEACKQEAAAIRMLIREYLTPRPAKPRGLRGRR